MTSKAGCILCNIVASVNVYGWCMQDARQIAPYLSTLHRLGLKYELYWKGHLLDPNPDLMVIIRAI